MTTNVTTPVLYALGTVTTMVSLLIIGVSLTAITLTQTAFQTWFRCRLRMV